MAASLRTFIDTFEMTVSKDDEEIKISKIVIPIIQRSYAQGRTDQDTTRVRERFIDSLHKAVTESPINLDFIYGDIDEFGTMTPLDGQQRLTTLFLLHWYAAKREKIEENKWKFLRKFSYETRYSARDFCKFLIDYDPEFNKKLSDEIIDQYWFPLDWKKDPTISSMLVMLDTIEEKFASVENLWEKLEKGAITYYFLPIPDMGLTDELYIKMNSRGKPLTPFEHFKAELERNLREIDNDLATRIAKKIDRSWTDMLWKYKTDDNLIDDQFLRYFKFICDIICYQQGDTPQGKSNDEFYLLDTYFSKNSQNVHENIELLENYFDCWEKIEDSSLFLNKFMSHIHEEGKIRIDSRYEIDIFVDCLNNYADIKSRRRYFPLGRIVLLYAITEYLIYSSDIDENSFRRRLRIINNLIQNSSDELSDSATRVNGNRIPAILAETKYILLNGLIDDTIKISFNATQLDEEKEKIAWLKDNNDKVEELNRLEDHPLLEGQIGIVGLEDPTRFKRFEELFACNLDYVGCALMTIGFYGQQERTDWRYQLGAKKNQKSWHNLFHKSISNKGYETTKEVLKELLTREQPMTNEYLRTLTDEYIKKCELENEFPFEYYFIKYDSFRPDSFGKYCFNNLNEKYDMSVLQTERNFSTSSYDPFLKELDEDHLSKDYLGQRLIYDDIYIVSSNSSYLIKSVEDDSVKQEIIVDQKEGVDLENRIEKMRQIVKEII